MKHDIWKFTTIILAAGLVGFMLEQALASMLITSVAIIAWQIYRINLLLNWVVKPRENPMPEVSGQLYNLYREISRHRSKNSKRKRLLAAYFSQFRKAVSAMPDAIVLIDDNGKIEWANKNADKVLSIRWPEDINVRFSDLIRYPEVDHLLQRAISKSEPVKPSVIVSSIRNSNTTINFTCVRYTNKTRMVIARDVSRLVRINQMHSDFVANVSHELKTPLTVLKGYVEILRENVELPEKFIRPLSQMQRQTIRMELIVGDLLYLAKLEDADSIKQYEAVSVTNIVNTIVESVSPLIEEKHHKLELDIDYSLELTGSQTELHSAFSNLITNAINYTPEHGVIKIKWFSRPDGAMFTVKDNGLGIAPHHIDRLTQRFYRVDADRSRDGGGTGLGLAIVKHVLQRHGAELKISSEEGEGSSFSCLFPATDASQPVTRKQG